MLAQALRERGLDTPELDARVLVAHALGLDHAALAAQGERILVAADRRDPLAELVAEAVLPPTSVMLTVIVYEAPSSA